MRDVVAGDAWDGIVITDRNPGGQKINFECYVTQVKPGNMIDNTKTL